MLRNSNFKTCAGARALRRALLGTSAIIAVGLASAAPALAECLPKRFDVDPGDTVTCSGVDIVGYDIAISSLTINVLEGASVTHPTDGTGLDDGLRLQSGTFTVSNRGIITGGDDGIQIDGVNNTINNWGSLIGLDQAGLNISNKKPLPVLGGETIINHATGIIRGPEGLALNTTGRIENHGLIEGTARGGVRTNGDVTIDNWGTIRGNSALSFGSTTNGSTVTNWETGIIESLGSTGIKVNESAPNATIINLGTITASSNGISLRSSDASIDNSGTISGASRGIMIEDSATGSIINNMVVQISESEIRIGKISGGNHGIEVRVGTNTIENAGNITGGINGILVGDLAVETTINNAVGGVIEGGTGMAILGGAGVELVTNAGSLIGNVDLGAGDDSFTHNFETGSVSGTVDGGDGTDTFGIMGTGTFAFPDWAVNFEAMEVGVDTEFVIDPKGDALDLDLSLSVLGTVTHALGTLNLTKAGAITVSGDQGKYNLADGGGIAGDGADARFLLTDMGRLVIKSPTEFLDPLGTKIDVPLETSGQGKIELLAKASLDIAKPGTYGGETTFLLDSGSRLSFSAPQTFNGPAKFSINPDPSIPADLFENVIISTSDKLTVKGELSLSGVEFVLGGDLDVTQGLLLINKSAMVWEKGVIKGGAINPDELQNILSGDAPDPASFLQFGLLNNWTFEMGLGIPEGGFQLDGIIVNNGDFSITHTLNLADNSFLINFAGGAGDGGLQVILWLRGDPAIRASVGANAAIISSGVLWKQLSGTSEIQVPFTSIGGDIRVDFSDFEGKELSKLVLRRASDFFGTVEVRIGGLSQLEFAHRAGELLTIHGTLGFTGSGTVKVSDADVLIKSGGRLNVFGGSITPVTTSAGDEMLKGSGGWVIDGGTTTIENDAAIFITEDGVLKWRKGTIIGLASEFAHISNFGVMDIIGSGPHVLNGSLVNHNQLTISGSITGTGAIFNTRPGSTVILDKAGGAIDVGVFFSNTKKVIVNFGTDATFSESVFQLSDGTLSGGQWIVNNQAALTLAPKSGSADIDEISDSAFVELRGTGTLNNLTDVVGDLDIDKSSKLFLRDVTDAKVSGQLNILSNSELRLFGSRLTVSGDLEMGSNLVDIFLPFGGQLLSTLVVDSGSRLTIRDRFEVLPGGIVNINGVVTADSLDIREGALFTGSGTINTQQFNNAGQLLPGNSPGIFTINGNYTQTSTGILEIEIGGTAPGIEFDQLIVNGTATFEPGSTIEITFLDLDGDGTLFEPQSGDTIDFLVAEEVVLPAGTDFADLLSFTNLPAGLQFEFGLTTLNGMTMFQLLALFGIDEGLLASFNPQGQLLGGYVNTVLLDNLGSVATDDILSDLAMLPGAEIPTALSQISPEAYGSLALSAISQATAVTDAVGGRFMRWHDPRTRKGISLWAAGLGARSSRDGDAQIGTSASDTDLYGVTAGIDVLLSGGILLGAMAGTTNADQTFDGLSAANDSDGVFVGGYAAFTAENLGLGVMAYHSFGDSTTERSMALLGESARGEGDFNHTIVSADLFYRTGGPNGWSVTPIVRATYIKVNQGALTETGSAGLAYDILQTDSEFLLLDTAIRLAGSYDTAAGTRLIPEITLGYRQELLKEPHNIQARFVGAAGARLTLQGADFGDGQVMLGAGFTARFAGGIDLFARYSGELGTFASSHRVTAGAQITF